MQVLKRQGGAFYLEVKIYMLGNVILMSLTSGHGVVVHKDTGLSLVQKWGHMTPQTLGRLKALSVMFGLRAERPSSWSRAVSF